jgi:hypothetical protein
MVSIRALRTNLAAGLLVLLAVTAMACTSNPSGEEPLAISSQAPSPAPMTVSKLVVPPPAAGELSRIVETSPANQIEWHNVVPRAGVEYQVEIACLAPDRSATAGFELLTAAKNDFIASGTVLCDGNPISDRGFVPHQTRSAVVLKLSGMLPTGASAYAILTPSWP